MGEDLYAVSAANASRRDIDIPLRGDGAPGRAVSLRPTTSTRAYARRPYGDPSTDLVEPFRAVPRVAPATADPPAGQNPAPYLGPPVFAPPTFNPVNGSTVGVAKPIIINFQRPIADRPLAEQAVHVSSNPPRFPASSTG